MHVPKILMAQPRQIFLLLTGGGWSPDGKTMLGALGFDPSAIGKSCGGVDQTRMRAWVTDFQDRYKQKNGRFPLIQTSAEWWNACVGALPTASRSPLQLLAYGAEPLKMPAGTGWKTYDFWEYASKGPFADSPNVWGGNRAQFMDFVKNANYKPLGVRPVAPGSTPVRAPFGPQDLAAVEPGSGKVYRYADGAQTLGKPSLAIPQGWDSVVSVHVSDVNRDGIRDLVSQWKSGNLAISYGRNDGMFAPAQVIGRGWSGVEKLEISPYSDRWRRGARDRGAIPGCDSAGLSPLQQWKVCSQACGDRCA